MGQRKVTKKSKFFGDTLNYFRAPGYFNDPSPKMASTREGLLTLLCSNRNELLPAIPDAPAKMFFPIRRDFKCLAMDENDEKNWNKIEENSTPILTQNLLNLGVSYITANAGEVKAICDVAKSFNKVLFEESKLERLKYLAGLPELHAQSLFFVRSFFAAAGRDPSKLWEEFTTKYFSSYFVYRILPHAVYANYFVSFDDQTELDLKTISSMVGTKKIQVDIVNMLLGRIQGRKSDINIQLYFGLRSHPYDCREIILSYLERKHGNRDIMSATEVRCLEKIHKVQSCDRTEYLLKLLKKKPFSHSSKNNGVKLLKNLGVSKSIQDSISEFVSLETEVTQNSVNNVTHKALAMMRKQEYPSPGHYGHITEEARRYWHTDYGRFLISYITSLYLLERRDSVDEVIRNHRLVQYIGHSSPFTLMSPHGVTSFSHFNSVLDEDSGIIQKNDLNSLVAHVPPFSDRVSVKQRIWKLKSVKRENRFRKTAAQIRETIQSNEPYYTGVCWKFVDEVEEDIGIWAFLNNPNAFYTLLLKAVEEKNYSSATLVMAFEMSQQRHDGYLDFVKWLIEEYGVSSHLFLSQFCTADNITALKFASSQVEAETLKLMGLELGVENLGFTQYLTKDYFEVEKDSFAVTVLMANVSDNPFSIPWSLLVRDYLTEELENEDLFAKEMSQASTNNIRKEKAAFQMGMGHYVNYSYNSLQEFWKITLVAGFFQYFLGHTVHGIESIFSSRIRHNHFQNQFSDQIELLQNPEQGHKNAVVRYQIIPKLSETLYDEIQVWLEDYIHIESPLKPEGAFDLLPKSKEMKSLIETFDLDNIEISCLKVVDWIKVRLEHNLEQMRNHYLPDLKSKIERSLNNKTKEILSKKPGSFREADLEAAEGAILTCVSNLMPRLTGWFSLVDEKAGHDPTVKQISRLVSDNFSTALKEKKFSVSLIGFNLEERHKWTNSDLRILHYLSIEVLQNAFTNSGVPRTKVVVRPYQDAEHIGVIFSNWCNSLDTPNSYEITGQPFDANNEALRTESGTGIEKIAGHAASLIGRSTSVQVFRKSKSFHIKVPLKLKNQKTR